MIFELFKDKSLHSLLSKVELDENTQALVKAKADISEIKKSLMDNITSDNIVSYRKYIQKADDEQTELAEREHLESEQESYTQRRDEVSDSDYRESQRQAGEASALIREEDAEDSAFKFLTDLENILDVVEKIASNATVKKEDNKLVVSGAQREYLEIGSSPTNSSKALDVLTLLKRTDNYIEDSFGQFLSDGILSGKTREKKGVKRTRKDLNVNELIGRVNSLLNLRFDVEDSDKEIDIVKVLTLLHVQQHKRSPPNIKPIKQLKREYQGIQMYLKGKSPKAAREYKTAKRKVKQLNERIMAIRIKKNHVDEKIAELERILEDNTEIVEAKLQRLNRALRTLMTDKERLTPEKITSMTSRIKDLQDNPKKYLAEAKAEIEKDLETEKAKLEKYAIDLNAAERVTPVVKRFNRILGMFVDNDPVDVIKRNLTKGMNLISKLNHRAKGIEIMASRLDDKIDDGLAAYLEDNPDVKLTLEADGLSFDGAPTVDARALIRMDELTDKFDELGTKLEEIVNVLENDIEGKKPEEEE